MDPFVWTLLAGIGGLIVGGGVVWAINRRDGSDEASLQALKREHESYRREVSEHFVETAELVNNLTNAYRSVYEHLERGAYGLVGEEELRRRLQDVDAEPVLLEYIGHRRLERPPGEPPEKSPNEPGSGSATSPATGPAASRASAPTAPMGPSMEPLNGSPGMIPGKAGTTPAGSAVDPAPADPEARPETSPPEEPRPDASSGAPAAADAREQRREDSDTAERRTP